MGKIVWSMQLKVVMMHEPRSVQMQIAEINKLIHIFAIKISCCLFPL